MSRDKLTRNLIAKAVSSVQEGENLGAAARRIFYEEKARYYSLADSNPDYVQHERMCENHFSEGFMAGADWVCWKVFGKPLLAVME